MNSSEILTFFEESVNFFEKMLKTFDTSVSLVLPNKSFSNENFDELKIFSPEYRTIKKSRAEVIDLFIKHGVNNSANKNIGETSNFESLGNIYLTNKVATVSIQFLKEIRGNVTFRSVSFVNGTIRYEGGKYFFKEISYDLEIGVRMAGLSFNEINKNPLDFITRRQAVKMK